MSGARDERGAFLVVWALLLVAVFGMVAVVIDLGQLRVTKRKNQNIADFAALAAGASLGNSNPQAACSDAWKYIVANADLPTSPTPTSPCAGSFVCPNPVPATGTTYTATNTGDYEIAFTFPVTDSDIADSRFVAGGDPDGAPCERMGVRVTRSQKNLFAGVIGIGTSSTSARAVVKSATGKSDSVPSLWLLDPTGCTSLEVSSNNGKVHVGQVDNPATPVVEPTIGGLITVDSDSTGASCSSTKQSLNAKSGGAEIWALPKTTIGDETGKISLYGMRPLSATTCSGGACDQGDVAAGRVAPQPRPAESRATRAPIDWTFNCKSTAQGAPIAAGTGVAGIPASAYPPYRGIVPIGNCAAAATRPAYIDALKTAIDGTAAAGAVGVQPPGFTRWTTSGPGRTCNPSGAVIAIGNFWFDCPSGLSIGNGTTLTILGNAVLDGQLTMTGSGVFNVNVGPIAAVVNPTLTMGGSCVAVGTLPAQLCPLVSSQKAAFLYMRKGDMNLTGGTLRLNKTMMYQRDGTMKINSTAPTWTSPDEGAFLGLSLWSEKAIDYSMAGGGNLTLEGTFFTPNANPFTITGGGGQTALEAQFISYHLNIGGSGTLNLVPNPTKNVTLPPKSGVLIR